MIPLLSSATAANSGVLPLPAAVAGSSSFAPYSDRVRSAPTVLLVDDDKAICQFAGMMLEWIGMKTVVAGNGLEALQALHKQPNFDAVFLDVLMPVMNGEDAFREIRKYWPNIPVILISGFDQIEMMDRFGSTRPEGFVQKPFTSEKLFAALSRVLR